jgi:hypothetical protein
MGSATDSYFGKYKKLYPKVDDGMDPTLLVGKHSRLLATV